MEPAKARSKYRNRTSHRRYRKRAAALKARTDTCHLCGQWIDPELKSPHPMSFSADHVVPVSKGGSNFGELATAHRICNTRRGNRDHLPGNNPGAKPKGMTAW